MTVQTAVAPPEPPVTANIYDLNLYIVTEESLAMLPDARVGDIYRAIMLPSGAVALVPLKVADLKEVRDSIEADSVRAAGTYIPLTAAVRF